MSTLTPTQPLVSAPPTLAPLRPRRITVYEFEKIIASVGLLVEVSATDVSADRQQGNIYGRSGIPVYWIVNLVDRCVEVYTDPGPAGYATRTDYPSGQQVPIVIDGQQTGPLAVNDILP